MQVIIIDTTGSVSDDQVASGTLFADDLMSKIDIRYEAVCLAYCGNFDNHEIDRDPLIKLSDSFRASDPQCVIHYITDGFITDAEVEAVDHIYMFENNVLYLEAAKGKLRGLVPVISGD